MKRQHPQKAARRPRQDSKIPQKKGSRRRAQKSSKPLPKQNLKRKRRTPLPPPCPVHGTPMLVGHVNGARQYRYCQVPDCRESTSTFRPIKKKTPVSPTSHGEVGQIPGDEQTLRHTGGTSPISQGAARGGALARAKNFLLRVAGASPPAKTEFFPEYCI
jgi:hypothetical protein